MCYQESQMYLSLEEAALAEESFSVYCKHVELYNTNYPTNQIQNGSLVESSKIELNLLKTWN